jgi:hypothetical protein
MERARTVVEPRGLRRTAVAALLAMVMLVAGCASVAEGAQGLRDRIQSIDLEETLTGLRDCDRLSEAFVGVVRTAADTIDELAARSDGRLPATEIRDYVDNIAVSQYFDIAEKIGCLQVQQRLNTIDRLRGIDTGTPAGTDFLTEILRQVEAQG